MTSYTGRTSELDPKHNAQDAVLREREQIWFVLDRAYQNIYGQKLPACPDYQKTLFDAVHALKRDARSNQLSEKDFLHICEDIIRISDEHSRLARQHQSRACNPVYLRETAFDNALEKKQYAQLHTPASTITPARQSGTRLRHANPEHLSSAEVMDLAYQQLGIGAAKTDA